MLHRILSRVVGWAMAHQLYSLDFEERGVSLWAFVRTWEKDTFRRVAVAVTDRFSNGATHDMSVLGSIVAVVGGSMTFVAVSGGSHALSDTYGKWAQSQASRIPNFRSAFPEPMTAKGIFYRVWIVGSLLDDGIYCHTLEGDRASRLDDVTLRSSTCHHYRRAVDAIACRGCQQHRGCLAFHRGLP